MSHCAFLVPMENKEKVALIPKVCIFLLGEVLFELSNGVTVV